MPQVGLRHLDLRVRRAGQPLEHVLARFGAAQAGEDGGVADAVCPRTAVGDLVEGAIELAALFTRQARSTSGPATSLRASMSENIRTSSSRRCPSDSQPMSCATPIIRARVTGWSASRA